MNSRVLHAVTGRLSLRPPQEESLKRLVRALEASPDLLGHERDVASILSTLKAEFPTLEDFEREFPSLCFALATGVGKTRLMGAFISYLHLAHGIDNFFVLAPNLTLKKIPKMVLARCEWGHDDYSLNVANLPMAKPDPAPFSVDTEADKKSKGRKVPAATPDQGGLFGENE